MAGMSMNRAIHGAVRRDLTRFITALEAFRPGDASRAQQLSRAWANFDDQLTHHHEGEHRIAWPALQKVGVALELLTRSPGAPEASAALGAMQNLRQVTVAHLEHEEAEIEPVYLANREAPQIKAMAKEFAKV